MVIGVAVAFGIENRIHPIDPDANPEKTSAYCLSHQAGTEALRRPAVCSLHVL